MSDKCKKILAKYITTLSISGIAIYFVLSNRGFFDSTDKVKKVLYLADAFTIPGVVLLMVGVMTWLSSRYGLFDGLSYSLGKLARSLIPGKDTYDERYLDYKERKMANRKSGYAFLFVCGGALFLVALVFTIIHACIY